MVEKELGAPIDELFSEFSPEPIAAASLAQVCVCCVCVCVFVVGGRGVVWVGCGCCVSGAGCACMSWCCVTQQQWHCQPVVVVRSAWLFSSCARTFFLTPPSLLSLPAPLPPTHHPQHTLSALPAPLGVLCACACDRPGCCSQGPASRCPVNHQ